MRRGPGPALLLKDLHLHVGLAQLLARGLGELDADKTVILTVALPNRS